MVTTCFYCGVKHESSNERTFHNLPLKEPRLLEKWLKNMGLDGKQVSTRSTLCSDHFDKADFICHAKRRRLKRGSVPTVFGQYKRGCLYCGVEKRVDEKRTFYQFPLKDENQLTKWISNIPLQNFTITKSSFLCSDHFDTGCFFNGGRMRMKPNAVPTIFVSKISLDHSLEQMDEITEQTMEDDEMTVGYDVLENILDTQPSLENHETGNPNDSKRKIILRRRIHLDHTYADSPRAMKEKLKRTTNLLIRERKINAALNKKTKRLSTRFNKLENIVRELQRKNSIYQRIVDRYTKNTQNSDMPVEQ